MNEKMKSRMVQFKAQIKKHAPLVVTGSIAVASSIAAVYYRKELVKWETVDNNAYPKIEVHPSLLKDVHEKGATLKYRVYRTAPDHVCIQTTTLEEFPPEAEEAYGNRIPNS
jgi:hypothetical protein